MHFRVLGNNERRMACGAAVLMAGLSAGCSTDAMRFSDNVFTGSTANQQAIIPPAHQPFPGDVQQAGLDRTPTGTVAARAATPQGTVGGQPLPPVAGSALPPVQNASLSAPQQLAPVAASLPPPAPASGTLGTLDGTVTGTTPVAGSGARQQGWSSEGGTRIAVREGDTVSALSRRYGVPESAILAANGLTDASRLSAGQQIVIPTYSRATAGGQPSGLPGPAQAPADNLAVLPQAPKLKEGEPGAAPPATNAATAGAGGGTYTVQAGDSLYAIARKTGVNVEAIKRANNLDSGLIRVGQTLTLPGSAPATQVASAPAPAVDPSTTAGTAPAAQPAAYTPPRQADSVIAEAEQTAAIAPEATGIGRMRWPARGRVISAYGAGNGGRANDGIDIAMPAGTPVRAAENGVVIYAGDGLKEFGNTVLVRHDDGLVTVYGHASEINVARGEKVARGQEIARSGMSGNADVPKLHFEVRKDSTPVDPMGYLE